MPGGINLCLLQHKLMPHHFSKQKQWWNSLFLQVQRSDNKNRGEIHYFYKFKDHKVRQSLHMSDFFLVLNSTFPPQMILKNKIQDHLETFFGPEGVKNSPCQTWLRPPWNLFWTRRSQKNHHLKLDLTGKTILYTFYISFGY